MAKYLSNRQKNLKIGISSYTESNTVLDVTGKVGIGTTNASTNLDVNGGIRVRGALYDGANSPGSDGQILKSTGTTLSWVDASDTANIQVFYNDINTGTGSTIINFKGPGISSVASSSGISTIVVDLQSNLDGGVPTSNYGGITSIDAGGI